MRRTVILALFAGLGFLAVAGTKPALSMPAMPTAENGSAGAGIHNVARRDRYWRRHYPGYAYGYRPYPYFYRPYGFYRPYAYYGYPYYYRRPGISLGLAF